jgi:hypothetical protein
MERERMVRPGLPRMDSGFAEGFIYDLLKEMGKITQKEQRAYIIIFSSL